MKWRTYSELPQVGQLICIYSSEMIFVAEYLGEIRGPCNLKPYPHILVWTWNKKGNDYFVRTFDGITARYWVPIEEIQEDVKGK